MIANGTLIQNTARQSTNCVIKPPSTGPRAAKKADAPAMIPSARPAVPPGTPTLTIAIVVGIISAAPTPCDTRIMIRNGNVGAAPASADDTVKSTVPVRKTRRIPNWSPEPATEHHRARRGATRWR